MRAAEFAKLIKRSRKSSGGGYTGCCPGHDDQNESLSFKDEGDRLLVKCFAACTPEEIMAALGLKLTDLFNDAGRRRTLSPPPRPAPLTVAGLAAAKQVDEKFLRESGLRDSPEGVVIEYRTLDGSLAPRQRLRTSLVAKVGSRWTGKNGRAVEPYVLGLDDARAEKFTFLCEGETDCLTLRSLSYHAIGIPGASMTKVLRSEHVHDIPLLYIVQERGAGGVTFIERLRQRLQEIGWAGDAVVIRMPDPLDDISDLWCASQAETQGDRWVLFITKLDQAIKDGIPLAAWPRPADAPGLIGGRAGRPPMVVRHLDPADPEHDLAVLTSAAWALIKGINKPPTPWLFQNGEALVRIERDDGGRPFFREVGASLLRYELAEHIEFRAEKAGPDPGSVVEVPVPPPVILVGNLLATPAPPVPRCRRIVTTPVFSADCRLVDQPGYDASAMLLYEPPGGFSLPPVPARPTPQDVAAAVEALTEPFDEFPFRERKVGLANTLGALLTAFARDLIDGPTPLNLFMKPTPGVGSTLMVRALGIIMTGTEPAMTAPAQDDSEWRKKITTLLIRAPQVVVLDNLRKIDSETLSLVLTSPYFEDRLLGTNKDVMLPVRCTWLGTGNNVVLTTEQFRRTVRIELEAISERPWLSGTTYRHPLLTDWVAQERARLVAAALTLIRAWIVAGRPAGAATLGTYESWAATVGGILGVANVEGFLGNLMDTSGVDDDEIGDIKPLVAAWWASGKFDQHIALTSELFAMADDPNIALNLKGGTEHQRRSAFGLLLKKHVDRVFDLTDGVTVKMVRPKAKRHDNRAQWQLIRLDTRGPREGVRRNAKGFTDPWGNAAIASQAGSSCSVPGCGRTLPCPWHSESAEIGLVLEPKTLSHPLAPPRGDNPDDARNDLEESDG